MNGSSESHILTTDSPLLLTASFRWTGGHAKRFVAQLVLLAWLWALRGVFARLDANANTDASAKTK